eukprot:UN33333
MTKIEEPMNKNENNIVENVPTLNVKNSLEKKHVNVQHLSIVKNVDMNVASPPTDMRINHDTPPNNTDHASPPTDLRMKTDPTLKNNIVTKQTEASPPAAKVQSSNVLQNIPKKQTHR